MSGWQVSLPLAGPAGEPVDLWRTLVSHGLNELPPARLDQEERVLEITVPLRARPLTVEIREQRNGSALVAALGDGDRREALSVIGRLLRLDEDLSGFYVLAAGDPDLAWAAHGAGRMMRGASAFEDVVKTICTTNCAWSGTVRMVSALVEHLGQAAPGAPAGSPRGRCFPTPVAMAEADEAFYRDMARAGYRGAYLRALADGVASGSIELEDLDAANDELTDDDVENRLLALPGVGPYAAAHVMMLLGRYSRLVLDSWTRPTYARLAGRKAKDTTIERRFRRYGRWAGLAFWLFLTRDWADDAPRAALEG